MVRRGLLDRFLIAAMLAFSLASCSDSGSGVPAPSGPRWGAAAVIQTDNTQDGNSPDIAVNGRGDGMAVWEQYDGTTNHIWANRYDAASGWGTATPIESEATAPTTQPQVVTDNSGNAVAVWLQSDGTRNSVWSNRYDKTTSLWGTPVLIGAAVAGDARAPRMAVDLSGNVMVVWDQDDGTGSRNVYAIRYDASSGMWDNDATLIQTGPGDHRWPRVAMDRKGDAVAVWVQDDGTLVYNVWSNRYDAAGNSWGTPLSIQSVNTEDANYPRLAMNASGDVVVVWQQDDGSRKHVWANRYDGTRWGSATQVQTDNAVDAQIARVAIDNAGNAVAVWEQSDGTPYRIWANRYATGSGWGTPVRIDAVSAGESKLSELAGDGAGNAVAVWEQNDGTRSRIVSNRFGTGAGWGASTFVSTDTAGDAADTHVAMNGSGAAVAVWKQFEGSRWTVRSNTNR